MMLAIRLIVDVGGLCFGVAGALDLWMVCRFWLTWWD